MSRSFDGMIRLDRDEEFRVEARRIAEAEALGKDYSEHYWGVDEYDDEAMFLFNYDDDEDFDDEDETL